MKTHNIKKLARKAKITELNEYMLAFTDFADCYFNTMYPTEEYFEVTEEQAEEFLKIAEFVTNLATDKCEELNNSVINKPLPETTYFNN